MNQNAFIKGCIHAWPVALGYFSISVTFGLLAVSTGFSIFEATGMSIFVFAGASQFIAVQLIANMATALEIIMTTFVLNSRHLLMSTSLARKMDTTKPRAALLSFGITDETFALASFTEGKLRARFFAGIAVTAYSSWILGTLIGALFGELIPETITASLGIALYAMFIALLIPALRKEKQKISIAILSAAICTAFYYVFPDLSQGWAIIAATLIAATVGLIIVKEEKGTSDDNQHTAGENDADIGEVRK